MRAIVEAVARVQQAAQHSNALEAVTVNRPAAAHISCQAQLLAALQGCAAVHK